MPDDYGLGEQKGDIKKLPEKGSFLYTDMGVSSQSPATISEVSRAIISSSFVGITSVRTLAPSAEISYSCDGCAASMFLLSSTAAPRKPSFAIARER